MKDLQKGSPVHSIEIDKVGIKNLILPLKIEFDGKLNHITAKVDLFVSLPKKKRGTHMSRMIRILTECSTKSVNYDWLIYTLGRLKKELLTSHSYINIEFTLFKKKNAPITKNKGFVDYKCYIRASQNRVNKIIIGSQITINSLCPISKSISNYGAHNQRGIVNAETLIKNNKFWFEDLIENVEKTGSAETFSVLKREDEKYITEYSFDHPKIVEDIVREVAENLRNNKNISEFLVSVENLESIHNHNAYSEIHLKNGRRN